MRESGVDIPSGVLDLSLFSLNMLEPYDDAVLVPTFGSMLSQIDNPTSSVADHNS
jgi:hypothetical protein